MQSKCVTTNLTPILFATFFYFLNKKIKKYYKIMILFLSWISKNV